MPFCGLICVIISLHFFFFFFFWQPNLYPTVGLQTPGEVVDANFGQNPFVYDIEEVMKVCINMHVMWKKLCMH